MTEARLPPITPRIPRTAVILRYILYEHRNGKDRAGRHENCRQDERIFVTHSNGGEGDGHRRGSQFITGVALTAVIISFLLLAAHFLRTFNLLFVTWSLLLPLLLLIRRKWAARILQAFLLLGIFEWITTTLYFVSQRQADGEPYGRMVLILGGVAAFTLASAFLLETSGARRRFRPRTEQERNL